MTADKKAPEAKKAAPKKEPATSSPKPTEPLHVEMIDTNPQTIHDVNQAVVALGGEVSSRSGKNITVKPPPPPDRNTDALRTKLVQGLQASPLVVEVT